MQTTIWLSGNLFVAFGPVPENDNTSHNFVVAPTFVSPILFVEISTTKYANMDHYFVVTPSKRLHIICLNYRLTEE